MTYKFTSRAQKSLKIASEISLELGHKYIATEHILYGLIEEGAGVAARVLENQGITPEKVIEKIEDSESGMGFRCGSSSGRTG